MSEFGCKHIIEIGKDPDGVPAVLLYNDDDAFYVQYFTDREELDEFIDRLKTIRWTMWDNE